MADSNSNSINFDSILNCAGNTFFDILETYLKTKISPVIRNILMINDIDTAIVFTTFNERSISDLEHFARNVFNADMLYEQEKVEDYLGRFARCQERFSFSFGQKAIIKMIADTCKQFYIQSQPTTTPSHSTPMIIDPPTTSDGNQADSRTIPSKKELISELFRCVYRWIRNQSTLQVTSTC